MQQKKTNIVLIGMAGAGKSTVGRALAQHLHLSFVDVDTLIEKDQNLPLQTVLDSRGTAGFRTLEEKVLLSIQLQNHVIATGGSAIYSEAGMAHLKRSALLLLLDVPLSVLQQRVGNFNSRGIVKTENQSFTQLYEERLPLYRKYADYVIPSDQKSVDTLCENIREYIAEFRACSKITS